MAKYLTRKELLARAHAAEAETASLREALSRANLTIATCIHVAEGGAIEKGTEIDLAVTRCMAAKHADETSRQILQGHVKAAHEETQKANEEARKRDEALAAAKGSLQRRRLATKVLDDAFAPYSHLDDAFAPYSHRLDIPAQLKTAILATLIADVE